MRNRCGWSRRRSRGPIIAGLARCTTADIDRAGWALEPAARRRIHIFIATSDLHLERKLRMSREACLDAAVAAVHRARRYTDDVQFSAEDATRSDLDFLCRVVEEVISAGCTTVNLPDTVGYSTPDEIGGFFRTDPRARLERPPRGVQHALPRRPRPGRRQHPGRGLPAARRQVECTINGVGERAGNASLEEIVMATRVRADLLPFETAHRDARDLPDQPAADGAHRRERPVEQGDRRPQRVRARGRHPPGRHAQGSPRPTRSCGPEEVGVPQATLVLGKHSGRHAVQRRCEQIGTTVDRHELDRVYKAVIELADREKVVSDNDLAAIVQRVRSGDAARRAGRTPRPTSPTRRPKRATGTGCRRDAGARDCGGSAREPGSCAAPVPLATADARRTPPETRAPSLGSRSPIAERRSPSPEPRPLLDRHALRQVPRLIDVAAAPDGDVVREQLQRHDHQHRRQQRMRLRAR